MKLSELRQIIREEILREWGGNATCPQCGHKFPSTQPYFKTAKEAIKKCPKCKGQWKESLREATEKFKVGVKTAGDNDWVFNGMRFNTKEEAHEYGANLAFRWTAVKDWKVFPANETKESISEREIEDTGHPKVEDGCKPDGWQTWGVLKPACAGIITGFRLQSNNPRHPPYPVKIAVTGGVQLKQGRKLQRVKITFLDDEGTHQSSRGWVSHWEK